MMNIESAFWGWQRLLSELTWTFADNRDQRAVPGLATNRDANSR